jgi:hypothetical protein
VPAQFEISSARAANVSSLAAAVTWVTTEPSTATVQWGPAGMRPLLWRPVTATTTTHSVRLDGLAIGTTYGVTIEATSSGGGTARTSFSFATGQAAPDATASTANGSVLVGGAPFFPLLTWQECPAAWDREIANGINLFAGNPCTGLPSLLGALGGRALAVGTADDAAATGGPGLVGWFHPDEADARGLYADTLPAPGPGLRFLTLTNHFYSGAAPLPQGRGMYGGLIAQSDVVGFDGYPLQEFCRPDLIPDVFEAQRELVALAGGRPTFQWIEVRAMKCSGTGPTEVTPATIAAESWLAIAGGARGLGFFPGDWGAEVGTAIAGVAARVKQLEPALLQPALAVTADAASVRASARELNGALYVIAVNAGLTRAPVRLTQPGLANRTVTVAGTSRTLTAQDGTLSDALPPLGVRIYVAAPS